MTEYSPRSQELAAELRAKAIKNLGLWAKRSSAVRKIASKRSVPADPSDKWWTRTKGTEPQTRNILLVDVLDDELRAVIEKRNSDVHAGEGWTGRRVYVGVESSDLGDFLKHGDLNSTFKHDPLDETQPLESEPKLGRPQYNGTRRAPKK